MKLQSYSYQSPAEIAALTERMFKADEPRRLKFIAHLACCSDRQRSHLLGMEGDIELTNLHSVAVAGKVPDVAESIEREVKRREAETPVAVRCD